MVGKAGKAVGKVVTQKWARTSFKLSNAAGWAMNLKQTRPSSHKCRKVLVPMSTQI